MSQCSTGFKAKLYLWKRFAVHVGGDYSRCLLQTKVRRDKIQLKIVGRVVFQYFVAFFVLFCPE